MNLSNLMIEYIAVLGKTMNTWVPLSAAVIGGSITALVTFGSSLIKSSADRDRELMSLAVKVGVEAFKEDRAAGIGTDQHKLPMSFYIFFHYNFLQLVEKDKATPDRIKQLNAKQIELLEAVREGAWGEAAVYSACNLKSMTNE